MRTVEIEMGNAKVSPRSRLLAVVAAMLSFGLIFTGGCSSPKLVDAFVTIVPGNTTVGTGATFTMYTSASPKGVTWAVSKTTGCTGNACGTLSGATDTSVVYNAPVSMSSSAMSVTITATSKTDTSISASQTLTVYPVSVQISGPSNTTVVPLTAAVFNASVPGDLSNSGVTWTITGPTCVGTTEGCGSFRKSNTSQATFVAPPAPQFENVTVTATSIYAPGESASITLSIPKLAIYVYSPSVLPAAIALAPGKTADPNKPTYSATVQVFGNTKPYTFAFTNLPSWLTVTSPAKPSDSSESFTLSGTPPAGTQGTVYPTVTVTDSSSPNPVISGQPFAITTYPAPPTGDALLNGSYAFYATGWTDGTSVQTTYNGIEYIGSFTADGNGNITGGELDINDPNTGITSYSTLGGTYNIQYGLDNNKNPLPGYQTGVITLVPPGKPPFPITLAVSLSSIQNLGTSTTPNNVATQGHFVEFDDTTGIGANVTPNSSGVRAQGSMALQSANVLNSAVNGGTKDNPVTTPFTGSYAFGMAGFSAVADTTVTCYGVHTCGPISLAGSMVFGSKGAITSGIEDVTVAENNGSAIALSGSVDNSGDTDASGRATASILAAANSHMPDWPSNFAIYAIDPQNFYFMSIDPYTTNSLVAGRAQQQNLANIASNPFSSQNLLLYGNVTSTTSFSTKGPNGQIRVELQLLTPAPTGPTAGKLAGFQWVNASGTYTANGGQPGTVGAFSYTVAPATGRVTTSTTGEPYLYLVDTNLGFGTQYSTANNTAAGLFEFQPQTATTLSKGFYSYYVYNGTSQVAPMETGILQVPDGGVLDNGTTVTIPSGTDYTSFGTLANVYQAGEPILFTGPITGTLTESGGMFNQKQIILPGQMQGCGQQTPQGAGWVISSTSFVCTPGGGSFAGIHIFKQ